MSDAGSSTPGPALGLAAEWLFEEDDLTLTAKLVPGAWMNLLRWPVAFLVVYVGVGASTPETGALFALGSGLVMAGFWVVLLLGQRGSRIRRLSKLPEAERRMRVWVGEGILRLEDARGRASEWPMADVTGAVVRREGLLFRIGTHVVFVPDRALGPSRGAWQEAFAQVPEWTKPIGRGFTYGLWAFAALVALYAFAK